MNTQYTYIYYLLVQFKNLPKAEGNAIFNNCIVYNFIKMQVKALSVML